MVNELGLGLGLLLALVVVALHYTKGTEWRIADDISQEVLDRRAASVPETDFPEPMNRSIGGGGAVAIGGGAEGELADEGAKEEDEGFDPSAIPEDEVEYFEVEYVNEGETIEVASNETILEAGEDEGWDLPYSCREGQCLSCGARIAEGDPDDIVHSNNDTLSDEELDNGYFLSCTAYPQADLSVETNETP
ncbi:2Fe-2S iron-sulfur cluster-binding protein [Haladaptatus sp. T7]|uniref:2Fe-2S iron-sulfur cluster-binding protein n=1 Tax=Haladaptatus sp. T7 TaxID=2029368 RepID=UPI0021A256AB|nr:2Fe-2S iron-sulfur cluster-binding protein [Haladaptatus sp. T7]GKZ14349.1 (2Fe-2S)-binding protein [Haladaptatus sp. T7]